MGFIVNGLGSLRTDKAPSKTKVAYKLMRLVDGNLYPLFIDSSVPVPMGVWLDADSPNLDYLKPLDAGFYYLFDNNNRLVRRQVKKPSKKDVVKATENGTRYMFIEQTEKKQRRFGENRRYWNIGINGSGDVQTFSMRPGWHAGSLPTMRQIGKGENKDLRDDSFVWTEIEISADIDYTPEAEKNPDNDLPDRIPVDGYYMKATNADKRKSQADKVGWYVAGAIKINRIIGDREARQIIDRFNESHHNMEKVLYDYERESGKVFDEEKMALSGVVGLGIHVPKTMVYYGYNAIGCVIFSSLRGECIVTDIVNEETYHVMYLSGYKGKRFLEHFSNNPFYEIADGYDVQKPKYKTGEKLYDKSNDTSFVVNSFAISKWSLDFKSKKIQCQYVYSDRDFIDIEHVERCHLEESLCIIPKPRLDQYDNIPYNIRRNRQYMDGDDWLFRGKYPTGTMYADFRWEEGFAGNNKGYDYLNICFVSDNGDIKVYNDSLPEYSDLINKLKSKATISDEEHDKPFYENVSELLDKGDKLDGNKLNSMAKSYGIKSANDIIQQAELGVVMSARKIAQGGESLRVRYEKIRDLYDNQPKISPKDGRSSFLQQYSTPAPLAFLAGEFVKGANVSQSEERYIDPTAGNGMLTISLPLDKTWVNELDDVRYNNLLKQGFEKKVGNGDATKISPNPIFSGVITNPPFADLEKKDYLQRKGMKGNKEIEYTFTKLDFKLAILAIENMVDNGRCAIIVGGDLQSKFDFKTSYWKNGRLVGEFGKFVNYINRQYNLIDILYINGDLYEKQGTTFPIVMLLVDGKKEWESTPSYIWRQYDETLDKPIASYSEYWDRMVKHIDQTQQTSSDIDRKRKLLILAKAKIKIAQAKAKNNVGLSGEYDSFIEFITNATKTKTHKKIDCSSLISEHSKEEIKKLTGKEIKGFYLNENDIRHIVKRHGINSNDELPMLDSDMGRIPDVLCSPTCIDLPLSNIKNGQSVRFSKTYEDGKIFCVLVDLYEDEMLTLKTGYKNAIKGFDALNDSAPKYNALDEQAFVASAKIVNFYRIK